MENETGSIKLRDILLDHRFSLLTCMCFKIYHDFLFFPPFKMVNKQSILVSEHFQKDFFSVIKFKN